MANKYIVMLVAAGLRDEYNGVKQNLFARQFTVVFNELPGLLADHEFLVNKSVPEPAPVHAFTAATTANSSSTSAETVQIIQQLVSRLGFQLQPVSGAPQNPAPQAFYTNRAGQPNNSHGRDQRGGRGGRHTNYNRNQGNRTSGQFSWASNQNTVYGTCNRCGIGYVPSQCPNRYPSIIRNRQPTVNYADFRSQASATYLPDAGSNGHASVDMSGFDSAEPYFGDESLHVGNCLHTLPSSRVQVKVGFTRSSFQPTNQFRRSLFQPLVLQQPHGINGWDIHTLNCSKLCFLNIVYLFLQRLLILIALLVLLGNPLNCIHYYLIIKVLMF
ncbi:hypothetical protein HanRHA438_Chr10g0443011 [Helianthus annuus]|nr:hypothetical protein HanRHA438_Chr10g0443011 [Helianthus annuus]